MRIYNPSLGKFLSVDPLTKKYPELTPYQFASNRPIDGIDWDGAENRSYLFNLSGDKPKIDVVDYTRTRDGHGPMGNGVELTTILKNGDVIWKWYPTATSEPEKTLLYKFGDLIETPYFGGQGNNYFKGHSMGSTNGGARITVTFGGEKVTTEIGLYSTQMNNIGVYGNKTTEFSFKNGVNGSNWAADKWDISVKFNFFLETNTTNLFEKDGVSFSNKNVLTLSGGVPLIEGYSATYKTDIPYKLKYQGNLIHFEESNTTFGVSLGDDTPILELDGAIKNKTKIQWTSGTLNLGGGE